MLDIALTVSSLTNLCASHTTLVFRLQSPFPVAHFRAVLVRCLWPTKCVRVGSRFVTRSVLPSTPPRLDAVIASYAYRVWKHMLVMIQELSEYDLTHLRCKVIAQVIQARNVPFRGLRFSNVMV